MRHKPRNMKKNDVCDLLAKNIKILELFSIHLEPVKVRGFKFYFLSTFNVIFALLSSTLIVSNWIGDPYHLPNIATSALNAGCFASIYVYNLRGQSVLDKLNTSILSHFNYEEREKVKRIDKWLALGSYFALFMFTVELVPYVTILQTLDYVRIMSPFKVEPSLSKFDHK